MQESCTSKSQVAQDDKVCRVSLPRRSRRYGVGKEIGGAIYLHRDYEHLIGEPVPRARQHLPSNFEYAVVKYSPQRGSLSFIASMDFDMAPEPCIGVSIIIHADGSSLIRNPLPDPYIYHHKWLFVADDYTGFDVEESKARSVSWMVLQAVDCSRIGRRSYWTKNVLPRL